MKSRMAKLKASELVEDFSLYPRNSVFEGHVYDLAESIRAGAALPPVVADAGSKRMTDGFHRRRAWVKVHGDEAELDVMLIDYPDDAAMFKDTITRNAAHGRRLTTADLARCAALAEKFRVRRDELAGMLHVTRDRLKEITIKRFATGANGQRVIVRRGMAHLAESGERLTPEQEAAAPRLDGQTALHHARQLVLLLETDSLPEDEDLAAMLARLLALLKERAE
jgi:hypothetical protein